MLLDARFDLFAEPETVKRERSNVSNAKLGHQAANDLSQKLRRLTRRNVLVIDMAIQPRDKSFE